MARSGMFVTHAGEYDQHFVVKNPLCQAGLTYFKLDFQSQESIGSNNFYFHIDRIKSICINANLLAVFSCTVI